MLLDPRRTRRNRFSLLVLTSAGHAIDWLVAKADRVLCGFPCCGQVRGGQDRLDHGYACKPNHEKLA